VSEETRIRFNVQYDVRGVHESVRETQRLLYFVNAVRLSIVDLQQVMSAPNIHNIMWTAIQLTRVWRHLYNIVWATNQQQRIGIAQGVVGTAARSAATGMAARGVLGQTTLALGAGGTLGIARPAQSLFARMSGMGFTAAAFMNPYAVASYVVAAAFFGWMWWDRQQKLQYMERQARNREMARSQGLEW
jgi:hypothetical protein